METKVNDTVRRQCRAVRLEMADAPAARAAKAYVAGERLDDALAVAERLAARGLGVTLGYWDSSDESPRWWPTLTSRASRPWRAGSMPTCRSKSPR